MPLYTLSDEDLDYDEDKDNEEEPPHPVGFGASWGRTYFALDPPFAAFSSPGRSTYALDMNIDDEDFFERNQQQSYPPLSCYVHATTAPTATLLNYKPPSHENDIDSYLDEEDDALLLIQYLEQQRQVIPSITSPSKPVPNFSVTTSKIQEKIQKERQRLQREHAQANHNLKGLIKEVERQAAEIQLAREAEENEKRKKEDERLREESIQKKLAKEKKEKEHQEKMQEQENRKRVEKERDAKEAQKTEYILKAKNLVCRLVELRASIEPFDKNKAVAKRRLGMKKIVRGRVNTLTENAAKVQEVAMEVSQAIATARVEDEEIKQGLERKEPGLTPDMARGKRYLIDLLASGTIQRVQAEGFNGPRGDGFPLAAMLAMVSLENKELVPILAAHFYTVCPTVIPTLPKPAPDASEDELMESLGMIKDKKGEYESFSRFLTRTESIVSLTANIMSSSPSTHILMGGHKGAVEWLTRFLNLLPPSPTAPLPLLTAPVLHGFLSGAGHMLANKHPNSFQSQLNLICNDVLQRLDEGPIGKPSSIRLSKLVEGGFQKFKSELPSMALPELYYGANDSGGHGNQGAPQGGLAAGQQLSGGSATPKDPFLKSSSSNPFGQTRSTPSNNAFGNTPSAGGNPFGGGGMQGTSNNAMNFGPSSSAGSKPHATGAMNEGGTFAGSMNTMSDASPFGGFTGGGSGGSAQQFASGSSGFGNQMSGPFGNSSGSTQFGNSAGASPGPSPFGSAFGGSNSLPPASGSSFQGSPFGGAGQGQGNNFSGGNRDGGGASSRSNTGKVPCKFFAQGKCKFGNNCKFSHETAGGGEPSGNRGNSQFGAGGRGRNPSGFRGGRGGNSSGFSGGSSSGFGGGGASGFGGSNPSGYGTRNPFA